MKCSKCQHDNPDGAKFCMECGAKLDNLCPKCGARLPTEAKFCMECGAKLGESTSPIERSTPRLEDMHSQLKNLVPSLMPKRLAQKYLTSDQYADGENRPITALFADISGFTALSMTHSSEAMFQMMQGYFDKLGSIIERYEGFISGCRGDGFLALFGVPLHENDAERAILAAIDIRDNMREQSLDVSIGINTASMTVGEVQAQLHSEYTAYGTGINLAARLQQTAQPGQIMVGAGTYRLTRFAFDFEPTQPLQLKGFPEPVTAYIVQQMKAHPEKLRGIEGLRAQMIGREREFADLKEATDDLISSKGGIVSVIGEAGLGKSRLSLELKEYLKDKDVQWYEGRSVSIGQTVSYWPFLDILKTCLNLTDSDSEADIARKLRAYIIELFPNGWESILPFVGRLLSIKLGDELDRKLTYFTPEQIRHQTLMALSHLFTELSHRKPLLLILEDMHWADDLSLDLMSVLMDQLSTNPLMLLCIYRPERTHRCWQIGDTASRKCPDRYKEIALKRLSTVQSYQLVESLLNIENLPQTAKDLILEKSEGNPFFIEEIIRWLIEHGMIYHEGGRWVAREEVKGIDVPDTIQSVLLARVDRLESETKYILQCASVIGRMFRYRLLEHLSEHERDLEKRLTELEGRELIYEERTVPELEYAFKHVLTQEATYQGILERRRMEFHRRVADGIESLYGDQLEKFYEELAHHYSIGGNEEKAIDYLLKSGVKAADQYSSQTALRYLDKAGELLDKSSEPHREEKALLYEKRGEVLQRIGQWTKAIKEYEEALKWCDDKHNRAEIYCKMGWLECEEMQDKIRGITHFELGLKELPENDNSIERVRLESNMVWSTDWWKMDAFEEKITRCLWLSEIAEKMGYKQELAILYAYIAHWQTYVGKNPDEYRQRALTIAEELGNLPKIAWVYYVIAMTFKKNQIYLTDHGIPYCLRSLQISEHIGDIQTVAMVLLELGKVYKELNWDEKAIESLERVLDTSSETKSIFPIVVASGVMELYGKQGQEDIVISTFLRIMRILTTLDIDEESQARVLLCGGSLDIRMDWIYMNFRNCYNLIGREREFPGIAQKVLMELLKDANSRPQKAWYYKQLMYICQELDDIFSAETYAKEFVLIVEGMGKPDYMAEFYHAYLVAGEVDRATDLAYKYLSSRVHRFKTFNPYYWFIITRYYKRYGYTDHLRKLAKQVQETMSNILKGITLFLEPVETVNANQPEFAEQFIDELIEDGWEWTDPAEDCSYRLLKPGIEIHVLPGHNDISRLLRNIESDFIIESCLLSNSTGGRFGGLFVWEDANNFIGLSSSNITDESVCMFAYLAGDPKTVGYHDFKAEKVWLRIERKGECFTGYVSFDGNIWYCCGWMNMALENLIKVGIGAWNPWTSESSYSRLASFTSFEYFKIYRPKQSGELT